MTQTVPPIMSKEEYALTRRRTPPYFWPDANVVMQMFLSVSVVLMVGYILSILLSGEKIVLEQSQRELLLVLFGIILGCFKDVYGFTFGSSAGQKKQGEAITKSLEDKDKIIANNVDKTAEVAASAAAAGATVAAAAAAPAAARAAAPPAAEEAAPPAVDAALREAGIDPHPTVVAWWTLLSVKEQADLNMESLIDPRVDTFVKAAKLGKAASEDLDYLVSKNLLTQARVDELKA